MGGTSSFREDIEGLRALAVVVVVLFHLRLAGVPGGFVGVDVFFVISGFVVTRSLLPRLSTPEGSLWRFYVARFWRLQPSFLLVLLVTLVASRFVLAPADLARAGQAGLASVALSANVFFWLTTSGYESAAAEESPLLQMWSLAVEEQYYLLWPWCLLLGRRVPALGRPAAIGAGLVALVALSEWLARVAPSFGYYMLPARLFELALGGALVRTEHLAAPRWAREAGGLAGLAMILGSSALLTKYATFPGLNALVPCLGTALLIQLGAGPSSWRWLFVNPAARFVGRVSYAWYLWHWAPIAFANYHDVALTPKIQLALGVGTFALASASYAVWEGNTRRGATAPWRAAVATTALAALAVAGVSAGTPVGRAHADATIDVALNWKGLECLFEAETEEALDVCAHERCLVEKRLEHASGPCPEPGRAQARRILVWGDSHAAPWTALFHDEAEALGWSATRVRVPGCPPLVGVHRTDPGDTSAFCQGQVPPQIDAMLQRHEFDAILLVARFGMYETGWIRNGRLDPSTHFLSNDETTSTTAEASRRVLGKAVLDTLRHLTRTHDVPVLFALPTPVLPTRPDRDRSKTLAVPREAYLESRRMLERLTKRFPAGVHVVDPLDAVCDAARCPAWDGDEPLYRDDNHLTLRGMRRLLPTVRAALDGIEARPAR